MQTLAEIHRLVKQAVVSKSAISANYDGRERRLCPHVLGLKAGRLRVLCYQYAGASASGLQASGAPDNWRCLSLEKLDAVRLVEDEWQNAERHSRSQTCIDEVEVDSELPEWVAAEITLARVRRALNATSRTDASAGR